MSFDVAKGWYHHRRVKLGDDHTVSMKSPIKRPMWESSSDQASSARRSSLVKGPCISTTTKGGRDGKDTIAPVAHGTY